MRSLCPDTWVWVYLVWPQHSSTIKEDLSWSSHVLFVTCQVSWGDSPFHGWKVWRWTEPVMGKRARGLWTLRTLPRGALGGTLCPSVPCATEWSFSKLVLMDEWALDFPKTMQTHLTNVREGGAHQGPQTTDWLALDRQLSLGAWRVHGWLGLEWKVELAEEARSPLSLT